MKIYFTLNNDGYLNGWSSARSSPEDIEMEVVDDHEVLNNAEIFKFVNGELIKDEERQQQLIEEYERERLMYALETPDSRFVAYSEHVLTEGVHEIPIEPMFRETISDYFLVPHVQNDAQVTILERKENSFVVEITGNAEVVFEINGKRKGYEN